MLRRSRTIVEHCDSTGVSFTLTHPYTLAFLANPEKTNELKWPRLSTGAESWVMWTRTGKHHTRNHTNIAPETVHHQGAVTELSQLGPCAPLRQDCCPRQRLRGMTYTQFNTHSYRKCAYALPLFHCVHARNTKPGSEAEWLNREGNKLSSFVATQLCRILRLGMY